MDRAVATVSCSCGMWCAFQKEGEPCWGKVAPRDMEVTDDDVFWIHACEGHDYATFLKWHYIPMPGVDNPDAG